MIERIYSLARDFPGGLWSDALHREVATLIPSILGVNTSGDVVTIAFSSEPDDGLLATIISGHGLAGAKTAKVEAIDARTGALIATGFEFPPASGQRFSLSAMGQNTLLGMNAAKERLTYPVNYNTIDDKGVFTISDAATVENFFLTAVATYRAHLDSGTALKDQVRAASSVAEVDAIVDKR